MDDGQRDLYMVVKNRGNLSMEMECTYADRLKKDNKEMML